MFSTIQTALQGINQNKNSMVKHSNRIAAAGEPLSGSPSQNTSLSTDIVGMIQSERGMEANVAVIRATDEMLGTLIDTFA